MRKTKSKPRLLVLNQYYAPGVEATAKLLHELCVGLTGDFDVTVLTGMLNIPGVTAGNSIVDGVKVVRVRSTSYDRASLSLRGLNYITYLLQCVQRGLRLPRPDVILCLTDPPMLADVGLVLARRFRVPLVVVSQDVFPEVAVELGRLTNPFVVSLLRGLVHFYLKRADSVVAIGETMRARLQLKGTPPERLSVIPNWVSTERLVPHPKDNEWSRSSGLIGKFVVMHSGNVGHAQNLDALVRSATFLRDLDDVAVVVIGTGARHADLSALRTRLDADIVRFMPYQDRSVLAYSLSAADVHVVGLASGLSGYVVPSRLYGILSVGRPVIVAADEESETAQLVSEAECGIVIPPGRPELLAHAIRDAHDGKFDLQAMGRRAREYAEAEADREIAVGRYRDLLFDVIA